jgi:hypothetical protein
MTSALFYPVHPYIIDLYINALTLNVLEENIEKTDPKMITKDIQMQVDKAASEYVLSAKQAEEIFGDPSNVQSQLNVFSLRRQGIA